MGFKIPDNRILIFDGAMGTMLQERGLKAGQFPELLNITSAELIEDIHREYLEAGADVVSANTFGANLFKAESVGRPLEDLIVPAVKAAHRAVSACGGRKFVALDIGPCGRVLQPTGDLSFEEAVELFARTVRVGSEAGADLILLETFTDLYELKAAVLAARENSSLPVLATMSFEENGSSFFGTGLESMVLTLEGLGVQALGLNCSLGPKQLVPLVEKIMALSSLPVILQPNAGLPVVRDGVGGYDVTPGEFALYARDFARQGVRIVGGCCGTTPRHIAETRGAVEEVTSAWPGVASRKLGSAICTPSKVVRFGDDAVIIGERLNPTGKRALQEALRAGDVGYLLREAVKQQEQGAHVLDLNVGLPDIDEAAMLARAAREIQGVVDLPLQLDSSNCAALEAAARCYNGKPLINSVNGKKESLEMVLPIVKKYGAAVLGLTLDDDGISETAEGRLAVARRIVEAAEAIGIPRQDVLIDCLVMTASAQQRQAAETLRAVSLVKEELGLKTVLGVSNVSFGLPRRPAVNRTMLAMALAHGLDAAIMNPGDEGMAETVAAWRVLTARDEGASQYISRFAVLENSGQREAVAAGEKISLAHAVARGLKDEAARAARELLAAMPPLEIIEKEIVPALDVVGREYEAQRLFLPQLIKSAEAAKSCFDALRGALERSVDEGTGKKQKIVIATVYGDIHDIGKNIVKVIMQNYNFEVIDLGRDVPPQRVAEAAAASGTKLVGLSALMTTTVASMKETIELLREKCPGVRIIVGGAVLTQELAEFAGADFYARDAMESVRLAKAID